MLRGLNGKDHDGGVDFMQKHHVRKAEYVNALQSHISLAHHLSGTPNGAP